MKSLYAWPVEPTAGQKGRALRKKISAASFTPLRPQRYFPHRPRGKRSGPGCGRAAVTSHRGLGSHGPEGASTGRHARRGADRTLSGWPRRADGAAVCLLLFTGQGIWDRPTAATDTGRAGAGASVLSTNSCGASRPPVFPPTSTARPETGRGVDEVCLGTFNRFAHPVHPLSA